MTTYLYDDGIDRKVCTIIHRSNAGYIGWYTTAKATDGMIIAGSDCLFAPLDNVIPFPQQSLIPPAAAAPGRHIPEPRRPGNLSDATGE